MDINIRGNTILIPTNFDNLKIVLPGNLVVWVNDDGSGLEVSVISTPNSEGVLSLGDHGVTLGVKAGKKITIVNRFVYGRSDLEEKLEGEDPMVSSEDFYLRGQIFLTKLAKRGIKSAEDVEKEVARIVAAIPTSSRHLFSERSTEAAIDFYNIYEQTLSENSDNSVDKIGELKLKSDVFS